MVGIVVLYFAIKLTLVFFRWMYTKEQEEEDDVTLSDCRGTSAVLPVFVYKDTTTAATTTTTTVECAICLGVWKDGERGRMLPNCGHTFHPLCVDEWLGSHHTCPLCRCSFLPPPPASGVVIDA